MRKEDLKRGVIVQHKSGKLYKVLEVDTIMEDSEKDWTPCVIYSPLYNCPEYFCFVRGLDSFLKSFSLV